MALREPAATDTERIGELVESSMTASHSLSPQEIEQIVAVEFGEDALTAKLDDEDVVARVAVTDDDVEAETVVGYAEGELGDGGAELTWLFVDPEHRGRGHGTSLFEETVDALRDAGAGRVRAVVLDANTEGHQFFEQFGFERAGERHVDIGDQTLVEYVFADPEDVDAADVGERDDAASNEESAGSETTAEGQSSQAASNEAQSGQTSLPETLPETESRNGTTTATTGDGERVFVARDEAESGTDAPFLAAYTDEDHTERFGFYCSNCGSLDVSMDDTERLECQDCGNRHAARSDESYDDSYL